VSFKNSIAPIVMTSINSNDIDIGEYYIINEDGFDEACYMLRITNRSKDDVFVSYDGVTDHDYIPYDTFIQIEPPMMIDKSNFRKLTKVYVRGTTSAGFIYVAAYFRKP